MKRGASGINLILGIDKPLGMTSHDVVNAVRRSLGERRVGHAGTLDPDATGVLVVGVGQGTRLMGLLTAETKSYLARIRFGSETDTDDASGKLTRGAAIGSRLYDEDFARKAVGELVGRHMQTPPAYSAISVDGVRAYARARSGEQVVLDARPIEIFSADLVSVEGDPGKGLEWTCAFTVSKGTYIRALARDLGRDLGSAAHLCALTRTASGRVTHAHCVSLDRVAELGAAGIATVALDPAWALGERTLIVTDELRPSVLNGRPLRMAFPEGEKRALVMDDRLVGIWEMRAGRLCPNINFPGGITGVDLKKD